MFLVKNTAGRIAEVPSQQELDAWLGKAGFHPPTEAEAKDYEDERTKRIKDQEDAKIDKSTGIYFLTVTQNRGDGFSVSSGALIKELKKLGYYISPKFENQKLGILYHNPYSIQSMDTKYRVIFTMFESDKIPDDWKYYLDEADLVIVPSKWVASVFKRSGVDAKVVPLGYDDTVWKFQKRENKRKARKDFKFLHYNAFNARKGFLELFKAFTKEFGKSEPVKLVLKTTLQQAPLPIHPSQYPNIEIITRETPEKNLANIVKDSDCFVFPSRGEGFGMTPLECMATGMPAIVPNAHGITEYFNSEYMYEAKVKEKCPGIYSRYKNQDVGQMVVCDVDDLRSKMRYVYEHQDEALAMGEKASEYVKQWTFAKSAANLKIILEALMKKPPYTRTVRNVLQLEQVS